MVCHQCGSIAVQHERSQVVRLEIGIERYIDGTDGQGAEMRDDVVKGVVKQDSHAVTRHDSDVGKKRSE